MRAGKKYPVLFAYPENAIKEPSSWYHIFTVGMGGSIVVNLPHWKVTAQPYWPNSEKFSTKGSEVDGLRTCLNLFTDGFKPRTQTVPKIDTLGTLISKLFRVNYEICEGKGTRGRFEKWIRNRL